MIKETAAKLRWPPAPIEFWIPGSFTKLASFCRAIPRRELPVLRAFYKEALGMSERPAVVKASLKCRKIDGQGSSGRELDALTAVASVLFNLDAALVR